MHIILYIYVCLPLPWGHLYISFEMVTQHQPELAPFGTLRPWAKAHYVTQMDLVNFAMPPRNSSHPSDEPLYIYPYTSRYHPCKGDYTYHFHPFSGSSMNTPAPWILWILWIRTIGPSENKKKPAAALPGAELSVNGSPWNCGSVQEGIPWFILW